MIHHILDFDNYLNINNINCTYINSLNDITLNNNDFSIFQLNISSISAHFNKLVALLNSVKNYFSIIILCETWLVYDFEYKLNGYITINSLGTFNKCDGVTILVKKSLNVIQIERQILLNCNSIHLILEVGVQMLSIICIYRSPNDDIDQFLKGLDLFLTQINKKIISIFCGDININIMKNSKNCNDYLNIMAKNGFLPCINNFTRESSLSKTCIDHIFSNNIETNKINSHILRSSITDHFATILILSNLCIQNKNPKEKKNLLPDIINTAHLDLLIKTENWHDILNYDNVDTMVDVFNSKISEFINYSSSPNTNYKTKTFSKLKEWINNGIIISIRNREKLSAKLRTRPFDTKFKQYYNSYRNILNSLLQKSKQLYYQKKLQNSQTNLEYYK